MVIVNGVYVEPFRVTLLVMVTAPDCRGAAQVPSIDPANRELPALHRDAEERVPRSQRVRTVCVPVLCRPA
jgi:hypothetical protein